MKKRIPLYILLGLIAAFIIIYSINSDFKKQVSFAKASLTEDYHELVTKRLFPNKYCDLFSGFTSYAWGGANSKEDQCKNSGCAVQIVEQVFDPMVFDSGGHSYKCVKK